MRLLRFIMTTQRCRSGLQQIVSHQEIQAAVVAIVMLAVVFIFAIALMAIA
jgi:hypothetical protein